MPHVSSPVFFSANLSQSPLQTMFLYTQWSWFENSMTIFRHTALNFNSVQNVSLSTTCSCKCFMANYHVLHLYWMKGCLDDSLHTNFPYSQIRLLKWCLTNYLRKEKNIFLTGWQCFFSFFIHSPLFGICEDQSLKKSCD